MTNNNNNFLMMLILMSLIFLGLYYKIDKVTKELIATTEKHSVHPYYGNYVKLDSTGKKCHPWDYCTNK